MFTDPQLASEVDFLEKSPFPCWQKFIVQQLPLIMYNIGYHQASNISCTSVGNKIVDHSEVVGASPVDAAPTTSSFST